MRTLQSQIGWSRRMQMVLAGAFVIFGLFFLMFGYRPQMVELNGLRTHIAEKKRDLDSAQARAKALPMVMAEVARLQQRVERFDKKLPKQQDLGAFIKDITQLSQQTSLRRWRIDAKAPKRNELYSETPIQIHFEGDYRSAFSFLKQAEQMQRLTRLHNVQIRVLDSQLGQVEVQAALTIYFTEG
jgi:Tfp pilus assembly protein PilO